MTRDTTFSDYYGRIPERGDIIVVIWRQRALREARVNGFYDGMLQIEWLGEASNERTRRFSNIRTSERFVIVKPWDNRFGLPKGDPIS